MWGSVPCEGRVRRIELGNCPFSETASNYALEWFSEAGSAPIRSAVKFYFDIDVRIFFSTSSKNIFFDRSKKSSKFFEKVKIFKIFKKIENFQRQKVTIFFEKNRLF